MANLVDVVVVTYNAEPILDACLRPLSESPSLNLVVVDNGSTDNSIEIARLNKANTIEMGWNSGFGLASNFGAQVGSAPYLLFLNPDVVTDPDTIEHLTLHLQDSEVDIAGCRLVQADGRFDHAAKRMVVSPWKAARFLLRRNADSIYLAPHLEETGVGRVDSVNGAYLMIKRDAFESLKGFDTDFWMYMEDVDLCWRSTLSTGGVLYDGSVSALHLKSATSGKSRSLRLNYHFFRSIWIFFKKHQAADVGTLGRSAVSVGIIAVGSAISLRDFARRRMGRGLPYR